jgi:hypothetical protein
VAALNACLAAAVLAAPVDAATMATARIGSSYGEARILVGTSTRLGITARSLVPGKVYTVALRSGSCSTMGMLILSRRLTASRYGKINATLVLTASQARLVVLPMSIRVGKHCGSFRAAIQPGSFVDGTWRVGVDIQPGTYRAPGGPPATPPYNWDSWAKLCRWARLSGFGGTRGETIAGIASPGSLAGGPQVVTIASTDAGFRSSGCGTWILAP